MVCVSCSVILLPTKQPGVSDFSETWWSSTSSSIAARSAFVLFNLSLDKLFDLYLPFIGAKLLSVNALKLFNFVSLGYLSLIILDDISYLFKLCAHVNGNNAWCQSQLRRDKTDVPRSKPNVLPDKTNECDPLRESGAVNGIQNCERNIWFGRVIATDPQCEKNFLFQCRNRNVNQGEGECTIVRRSSHRSSSWTISTIDKY